MLLLVATTDKIQVVTSVAATVDVHASFMDASNADPPAVKGSTSGRQNTAISTATTTDVVAAPASSTTRNVKTLHIFNKDSANTTDVTVLYNQNGTTFQLWKSTLAPGEALEYVEGLGWFEAQASVAPLNPVMSTADQTVGASTTAYLTSSGLALNGRSLRAGTVFAWDIYLKKSGAATASMTFDLRVGTAGTTGDTSRASLATGTQTAVADIGHLHVQAIIRSISATGTLHCGMDLEHNLASTGLGPTANIVSETTSGTFDTTATNLIFGISLTTSTSHSITIMNLVGQVFNVSGASRGT